MKYYSYKKGITSVEIVIGVAILGVLLIAAVLALALFVRSATESKERVIALYLAEAGLEYMKQIRSEDWTNISGLASDTDYYFDISTTTLATSGTPEVIDNYYNRSFFLTDLYRDANDDITPSTTPGSTVDSGSYYVTVEINYGSSTVEMSSILANIHNE